MPCAIHPYERGDRDTVRRICCETGFQGSPVDPFFGGREAFADYFTRHYTETVYVSTFIKQMEFTA